eukprot:TRINITY_DN7954_c0_g1_i4.p1 TRINITY_DN7954_c0_g1~~TRINITY_DN7954_c0_g1_i4.p1  ORF type:complete len:210 (-),score=17.35 TRINITY_DN7954_c0_g1_i4:533-1162(-)
MDDEPKNHAPTSSDIKISIEFLDNIHYQKQHAMFFCEQLRINGYITLECNTDIAKQCEKTSSVAAVFFDQCSAAEKYLYSFPTEGVGYTEFGSSRTEGFVVHLPSPGSPFPWPNVPDDFEAVITNYFYLMQKVGTYILQIISLGLEQYLETKFSCMTTQDSHLKRSLPLTKFLCKEESQLFSSSRVPSRSFPCQQLGSSYSNSVLFIRS